MSFRYLTITIAICLIGFNSFSQVPNFSYTLPPGTTNWEVDALGNLYVFNSFDLSRIGIDGSISQTFSSRDFGYIGGIDVSDAFSPLLTYPAFNKVIELDNSFAIKSNWSPSATNGTGDLKMCRAPGNGYWSYDRLNAWPVLFDQSGRIIAQGTDITAFLDEDAEISKINASDDNLVFSRVGLGLFVFDRFGTFIYHIPGENVVFAGFSGSDIFYFQGGKLYKREPKKPIESVVVSFSESNIPDDCKVNNGRIYIRKGSVVSMYVP
ncbi:MAG: hypothetical protein ACK560_02065 [Bacteroidota bacterium]|jgi:hypothetical protein